MHPKGPVFVSLPIDVMEQETSVDAIAPDKLWRSTRPDPRGLEEIASLLLKSERPRSLPAMMLRDREPWAPLSLWPKRLAHPCGSKACAHHASFPTSHPNYRQSLPGDAAQVRNALQDADLVLLLGGPFFEDIWYAAGGHFPEGAVVVQIEESSERLAFNHHLDAGIVGDIATSLVAH